MRKSALALVACLALCFAVAGLGGWWTASSVQAWYPQLRKPTWTPPNWLFGPVWTALYLMMAIAAWLIWRRRDRPGAKRAMILFGGQLALNLAWSGLFFGLKKPGFALADIAALWLAIGATIAAFHPIDKRASALLIPYLAWVSFAAALNYAIWSLN